MTSQVRVGLTLPIFGPLADPSVVADIAVAAEDAGLDGVFVWDHVLYRRDPEGPDADGPADLPVADPWIVLAAMASRTVRIRLGPMVTPLARRRPQVLARQVTSLDLLSDGRTVLGIGLGGDRYGEFSRFGDPAGARERGAVLDEALTVLRDLWAGDLVEHRAEHVAADGVRFLPRPVQSPHPPVWAAGRWPNRAPMRRAATCDGFFPIDLEGPDDLAQVAAHLTDLRGDLDGYDLVAQGRPGDDRDPWVDAGATWWLTTFDPWSVTVDDVLDVIAVEP